MRRLNGRELKALFVLSIVAPVSILASLRLTGILQEPITISETTTIDAIEWAFERPYHDVCINDRVEAAYVRDGLSAAFCVVIGTYSENQVAYDGNDIITIGLELNSTVIDPNGFMESVNVVFRTDSQPSLIDWVYTYLNFQNLSLVDFTSGWTTEVSHKEAYVRLAGLNHPERISIWATAVWSLLTQNDQTHQREITYELTYFNGTAYKKIIQPFRLKVVGR